MKTSFLLIAAAAILAPISASAQDILSSKVLSTRDAAQVTIGSKKALGYYGKSNGKCDLTVMVIEHETPTERSDASAARIKVAIVPGSTASIEAESGRSVSFFCGSEARRMTVMTHGDKTELPNT